jgi:predicted nucleic acid-binding protein
MYVVDTNIINWLLDGRIGPDSLPIDGEYVATHVQRDELAKTNDDERRVKLFAKFQTTIDRDVPRESVVAGISRVGLAKVSDGKLYCSLGNALAARNKGKLSNSQDALIAEVAINNGWTLLTADGDLAKVAADHGCKVQYFTP